VHGVRPEQLIGQRYALYTGRDDKVFAEIVGVVRDVRLRGPETPAGAQLYVPHAQRPAFGNSYLVIKTTGDPRDMMAAARAAVRAIDANLPPYDIRTFDAIRASYVAERRFAMLLMTAFAVLTGALAAIGLYGVMTYLVQLRTREIGIRVALGATPGGVLRETMRGGLWCSVPGVLAGVALAAVLSRLFISRIPGLQPADPATLGLSAAVMLVLAVLTTWIPARRAGRIDPVEALRAD
jgi:ABC-type antimicrobial peptide transport system permease subunit